MAPGRQQHRHLQPAGARRRHPQRRQLRCIALVQAIQRQCRARHRQVVGKQGRKRQPQHQLQNLCAGPAEIPPRIQRPQPQCHVGQQRAIQQRGADHALPDEFCTASIESAACQDALHSAWSRRWVSTYTNRMAPLARRTCLRAEPKNQFCATECMRNGLARSGSSHPAHGAVFFDLRHFWYGTAP